MKLGWIVLGGPAALRAQATERLELIADTYLSVGTPVQHALPCLLTAGAAVQRQIGARTQENLAWLRSAMAPNSPAQFLEVEGGWYATLRVPRTRSEEEWCLELLERDHVLVQPGYFYDFESEAFLVLSLLTPTGIFREGVRRLLNR
jgi:aspartate/methionine/tyrosine aminotransferase